jgi:hypothetical protein
MLKIAIEERKKIQREMEAWKTALSSSVGHEVCNSGG